MTACFSSLFKKYCANYAGLSRRCWRGILLNFIESALNGVFCFLSFYFVNILGINMASTGMIVACYGMGAIVGGMIGGRLSDRISPATVSAGSLLLLSLGYLFLIKLKTVHALMGNLFVLGMAAYSFLTSNHLWVLNQCAGPAERLKALNILAAVSNLGISLAALITGLVAGHGFHGLFFTAGVILFFSAGYLVYQEYRSRRSLIQSDRMTVEVPISIGIQEAHEARPMIGWVLFLVLLTGSVIAQTSSTYSVYIQEMFPGLGVKAVSGLFILNTLLVVFCQTPLVNFLKERNKVFLTGMGSFLIGLGMFILGVNSIFLFAVIGCVIYTVGEMIFFSMAQFICYQKGQANKKGLTLGMYRMTYAASRIIGPAAGGAVYHYLGGPMVWYISGIIGVVCLAICISLRNFTVKC
jgi:predicted MFS family arabinose efflux permease